jgi:hypothetical protein
MREFSSTKREKWERMVAGQRASGQSVRAWCQAHGCAEHSFYWWRAKLARLAEQGQQRPAGGSGFAELIVDGCGAEKRGRDHAEPMVLKLSAGRELVLPGTMPVVEVARLLGALEKQAVDGEDRS